MLFIKYVIIGKHFELAAHLIEAGYGRVTHDTLSLIGEELPLMMKIWVTETQVSLVN